MIIPQSVEDKIRYMCNAVHDTEWSGILFYKPEGSIDDGTFKVTCLDIFVMDIGSSTFTEFTDNCDIIAYQAQHPELLDSNVQEALIHSHNHMAAFFSGTDTDTLLQEGNERNHFVSLIVNNAGQYVAKITRKVNKHIEEEVTTQQIIDTSYSTYNNAQIIISKGVENTQTKSNTYNDSVIEAYDFNIYVEPVNEIQSDLSDRINEIKEQKAKRIPKAFNYSKISYQPNLFEHDYQTNEPKDIKLLAAQLLTGNILIDKNHLDLQYYSLRLDERYEKRFGSFEQDDNLRELEEWLSGFIDYLLCSNTSAYVNDGDIISEIAIELSDYITMLHQGYVTTYIINILNMYIS